MDSLILKAARYAIAAHAGQVRKYSGAPYVTHPARVATRATLRFADHPLAEDIIAAAWLHDVAEDCFPAAAAGLDALREAGFPPAVVGLCDELTEASHGSKALRKVRKQMDRDKLALASQEAKVLKLIDRLDNVTEMRDADSDFVGLYTDETLLLVEVLRPADESLAGEVLHALLGLITHPEG